MGRVAMIVALAAMALIYSALATGCAGDSAMEDDSGSADRMFQASPRLNPALEAGFVPESPATATPTPTPQPYQAATPTAVRSTGVSETRTAPRNVPTVALPTRTPTPTPTPTPAFTFLDRHDLPRFPYAEDREPSVRRHWVEGDHVLVEASLGNRVRYFRMPWADLKIEPGWASAGHVPAYESVQWIPNDLQLVRLYSQCDHTTYVPRLDDLGVWDGEELLHGHHCSAQRKYMDGYTLEQLAASGYPVEDAPWLADGNQRELSAQERRDRAKQDATLAGLGIGLLGAMTTVHVEPRLLMYRDPGAPGKILWYAFRPAPSDAVVYLRSNADATEFEVVSKSFTKCGLTPGGQAPALRYNDEDRAYYGTACRITADGDVQLRR